MSAAAGAALVTRIGIEGLSDYMGGMKKASDEVDKFAKKSNRSLGDVGRGMTDMGKKMTRNVTLPIAAAGTASFVAFAGFDKTVRQFGANAGVSGNKLKSFSALAMKMGKDTSFSAGQAAQAMLELSKGRMTAAEIKAGGLEQTLTLAAAGGIELGDAAGYMANTLNSFGMNASQASDVAAALAGGANKSTASVESLGRGLSQVGMSAKNAGMDLNETVATLALMDDMGVKGSDAGTSLKAMLNSLTPASKEAADAIKKNHLEFTNANGTFKSTADIAQELKTELGGLTQVQRAQALETIFGSDGMRAATALMDGGAAKVADYTAATKQLDAAQKMAKVNTSGAAGAIEQMGGSIETAGIAMGQTMAPAVISVMGAVTSFANEIAGLPDPIQAVVVGVGGLAMVAGPALMAIGQIATGIAALKTAMTGFSIASLLTNPLFLVGAGAAVAVGGIAAIAHSSKSAGDEAKKAAQGLKELKEASEALKDTNTSQVEADLNLTTANRALGDARRNLKTLEESGTATKRQLAIASEAVTRAEIASAKAGTQAKEAREKNSETIERLTKATSKHEKIIASEAAKQSGYANDIRNLRKERDAGTISAYEAGISIEKINRKMQESRSKSASAAAGMASARKELEGLGPAAKGSQDAIREINNLLNGLPKDVRVNVDVMYKEVNKPRNFGTHAATVPVAPNNSGGLIRSGSMANKDSVFAHLTRGEYVMDRKTVEKFGPEFFAGLQGLNRGGVAGSLKAADTRARRAANPTLALKDAEAAHRRAITAVANAKPADKKQKREEAKAKADAVIQARKALADFRKGQRDTATQKFIGSTEAGLSGENVSNSLGSLKAQGTKDLGDDIRATDAEIGTNNKRIAGLTADLGKAKGAAKEAIQEQLNSAIEKQVSLDTQRNQLIEQQNDAVKQAALDLPKSSMVLKDANTNLALAIAKGTPGIEDDLAAMGQALKDEEERRVKINAALKDTATTDTEKADLTNQLADSVNATNSLTAEMKQNTEAVKSTEAELDQLKRQLETAENSARLANQATAAFAGSADIGYGGGNSALQSANGTTVINNTINTLHPGDPRIQKSLSETSNSGNSFGGDADRLYSGRVA